MTDRLRALLVAALAALRVRNLKVPELRLVHTPLDSWRGIGLIVVGMARQGFQVTIGARPRKVPSQTITRSTIDVRTSSLRAPRFPPRAKDRQAF